MGSDKTIEYETRYYPKWVENIINSGNVIFLPGLMGSELYDLSPGGGTLWVNLQIRRNLGRLAYERLEPSGSVDMASQCIVANRTTHVLIKDYYDKYMYNLGNGCFCYDWRESIALEARRLAIFIREKLLPKLKIGEKVSFVAHSMGCVLLLRMLGETGDLYERINKIVFIGPPFWGAMSSIQVLEHGNGSEADWILPDSELRKAAATMTGVFNMLPAPQDFWPDSLPGRSDKPIYPIRTGEDLFSVGAWSNIEHKEMRETILRSAYSNYQSIAASIPRIVSRFREQIYVIIGVRGKTPQLARRVNGDWRVESTADEPRSSGKRSKTTLFRNGDGRVLTQSSWIKELGMERYFVWIPDVPVDTHGKLPMIKQVIEAIRCALRGDEQGITNSGLYPLASVTNQIDWSRDIERVGTNSYVYAYNERARLRALTSPSKWGSLGLNPIDSKTQIPDSDLFVATRAAAIRVMNGGSIRKEASKLNVSDDFIQDHVYRMIMPLL